MHSPKKSIVYVKDFNSEYSKSYNGKLSVYDENYLTEHKKEKPDTSNLIDDKMEISSVDAFYEFWTCIALCNDIIPLKDQNNLLTFQGPSQDELTLIEKSREVGFILEQRKPEFKEIRISNKLLRFRILSKIEFTSERKCMSIIVKENSGSIKLYIKGADSAFEKKASSFQPYKDFTEKDSIMFGKSGYRILYMGMKSVGEMYFQKWYERYLSEYSQQDSVEKYKKLNALYDEIEDGILILGSTALEDKLQDCVPEAIHDFRKADIKVWMLTGDKKETAENIGTSCQILEPNSNRYYFEGTDVERIKFFKQR